MFKNLIINAKKLIILDKRDRELLEELKGYKLTDGTLSYYRYNVKNNINDTYEVCKNKLIRNILLGKETTKSYFYTNRVFKYGNLLIYIDTNDKTIYWLENLRGRFSNSGNIDKRKKKFLNEILGIE